MYVCMREGEGKGEREREKREREECVYISYTCSVWNGMQKQKGKSGRGHTTTSRQPLKKCTAEWRKYRGKW